MKDTLKIMVSGFQKKKNLHYSMNSIFGNSNFLKDANYKTKVKNTISR
jgi:hypothetical protein